jgi:hypothetical protein
MSKMVCSWILKAAERLKVQQFQGIPHSGHVIGIPDYDTAALSFKENECKPQS